MVVFELLSAAFHHIVRMIFLRGLLFAKEAKEGTAAWSRHISMGVRMSVNPFRQVVVVHVTSFLPDIMILGLGFVRHGRRRLLLG